MDRLPHIPKNEEKNSTLELLSSAFRENIEADVFPLDTAKNINKYVVDDELSLKEAGRNVLAIDQEYSIQSENIKETEREIIKQHGEYICKKYLIDQNIFLRELTKLKPCEIFTNIDLNDVEKYGLIQKCDLYPKLTRQFLDFCFNKDSHQCQKCFPVTETKNIIFKNKTRSVKPAPGKFEKEATAPKTYFILNPKEIIFSDFDTDNVYEQKVKIINISPQLQTIALQTSPKLSIFSVKFQNQKIASGMSAIAKIRFTPEIKLNMQDEAIFQSFQGHVIKLPIKCQRNPPNLLGYIYKTNDPPDVPLDQNIPGSRNFSKKRQRAVNDTIDCGSCFVTNYVLVNLLLVNKGTSGKFFWISEEDFYSENVNKISTALEFCNEGLWLYPTYFEMLQGQTYEINIIFQPMYCGLHVQTLFLMCDNNSFRQIEIVADSVCFNRNMISVDIPDMAKDIDKQEGHCIFIGHARDKDFIRFTLCITNHSLVFLKYEFQFHTEEEKFDMSKWIQTTNTTPALAPYSVTDIVFHVKPDTNVEPGYYKTALRLFMKDIPIASLNDEDIFLVSTNHRPLEETVKKLSVVDVLVLDVTVACYMEPEKNKDENNTVFKCKKCGGKLCSCKECKENIPQANLVFSESLLDMGKLPTGVDLKKDFYIMNLGKRKITWKIVEIKYNISANPYVEIIPDPDSNVSLQIGTLLPEKKQQLNYNIVKKLPTRYVSILVLFSISTNKNHKENQNDNFTLIAESICVVTYEIIQLDIVIKTGSSEEPILCPLKMLYTGVPLHLSFKIQNFSIINGCFYFLKPIGKDADKIHVEYKPQFGELKPRSKKNIVLKLICNDVGILEDIFLPCFIGQGQDPILVRLLCVVDCIHVFFYLPNKCKDYEKILWPPKVLYEYDRSWSQYCMCEDLSEEHENMVQNIQSENTTQIMEKSSKTLSEIKTSKLNISDPSELDCDSNQNLLKMLVNVDSEIFLQDYIVQVENVPTKQQELWEPMIRKHGILVHPETESGTLNPQELLSANIWIYANTWGLYTEEIVVDIEDIACFAFSMIIEVVGCPLHIPLSLGAITKYPTIRFGSFTVGDDSVTKNIAMLNTSMIDVKISWHTFYCHEKSEQENLAPFNFICDVIQKSEERLEFDLTERFFGLECADCVEVLPSQLDFPSNSKTTLPVTFKPWALQCNEQKYFMRCYILGRIFMQEKDRKYNSVVIEVTASVEKPCLSIIAEAENNTLYVYANEVALNREAKFYIKLLARNATSSVIEAQLGCSEPFALKINQDKIILNPGECKQIKLLCMLSYEKMIKWAPPVYNLTEIKHFHQPSRDIGLLEEVRLSSIVEKDVDDEKKILTLRRKLFVYYKGGMRDAIPLNVCIYYPNIAVKPIHVKFGYLLIGRTQKTSISVYNLTGYRVLFEILKSTSSQEIVVTPCYGEIEKSTGMNHSFVNITIYFTPSSCRNYQESIRICTNIPQYHIDIPIKGAGSFNEKFDVGF